MVLRKVLLDGKVPLLPRYILPKHYARKARWSLDDKILRVKLYPTELKLVSPTKSNINKYITFVSGTLLAISETLPFFDNTNGNGILHILSGVQKEFKDEFEK